MSVQDFQAKRRALQRKRILAFVTRHRSITYLEAIRILADDVPSVILHTLQDLTADGRLRCVGPGRDAWILGKEACADAEEGV